MLRNPSTCTVASDSTSNAVSTTTACEEDPRIEHTLCASHVQVGRDRMFTLDGLLERPRAVANALSHE